MNPEIQQSKIRVGVILGGVSSEKEVSLESGRNIFSKINRKKYEPVAIFMDSRRFMWEIPVKLLMRNSTSDIEMDLREEAKPIFYEGLKDRVDLVCIGLHGKYGEDGCCGGLLELLKIPYTGSGVLGSALGMDKYASRKLLKENGIDVPETVAVERRQWLGAGKETLLDRIERVIGFPCVVKPSQGRMQYGHPQGGFEGWYPGGPGRGIRMGHHGPGRGVDRGDRSDLRSSRQTGIPWP